jgi:hypothetical protein
LYRNATVRFVTRKRKGQGQRIDPSAWPGGELRVTRVLELGGVKSREDLGAFAAEPFGEGLALVTWWEPVCDEEGVLLAEIEVGVVNGRPGVRAIHARGSALSKMLLRDRIPRLASLVSDVVRLRTVRLALDEKGEIVGEFPQAMPMRHILSAEGQIVGGSFVRAYQGAETLGPTRDALDAEIDQHLRSRHALTPRHLKEVARVYRDALAAGISTQRAIQDRWPPISGTTARRWVLRARREGYLEPALGPWKAGEQAAPSRKRPNRKGGK